MSAPKLVLCVVDSLRTDKLEQAVADGTAPILAKLMDRGTLIRECVSSFPSVTPVCTLGDHDRRAPDGHWISGMNWYHRAERRYVEYGSSFEATRAFGLFRSLYDTVYNMNMAHLSDEAETVFERLADHGVRTACTPFLIYRGRTRHELGLEGLLRRVALAATFRHATYGPDELFYGELYSSRKVPCKPTLARPDRRDEYSACCRPRARRERPLRLPALRPARQRLPLASLRPRRAARVDRARRRGAWPSSSTPAAGSTGSWRRTP